MYIRRFIVDVNTDPGFPENTGNVLLQTPSEAERIVQLRDQLARRLIAGGPKCTGASLSAHDLTTLPLHVRALLSACHSSFRCAAYLWVGGEARRERERGRERKRKREREIVAMQSEQFLMHGPGHYG